MLIALLVPENQVRLAYRTEEEIAEMVTRRPEINAFYLTTDISMHNTSPEPEKHGPHLLSDCWCGGS